MRIRTITSFVAIFVVAGVAVAAAPQATNSASTAKRVTVKVAAIPAVSQFTVKVPVRLANIGARWKRGAVQCDYKAMQDIGMPNIFNPTEPPATAEFELGNGSVAKAFPLSGSGNYNSTLSLGWSWSGNQAGLSGYRQTYKCRLLVTESSGGDNDWYYASDATIDVDSGSAYRVVVEGEIK